MKRLKLYWKFWKYGFTTAFWILLSSFIISFLVVIIVYSVYGLTGILIEFSITQTKQMVFFAVAGITIGIPLFGWFLSKYFITAFYKRSPLKKTVIEGMI